MALMPAQKTVIRRGLACGLLGLTIFPFTVASPADNEDLEPPGDCTKARHKVLKAAVGTACKSQSMACDDKQDCATLAANYLKFGMCIKARDDIMRECFRGGNETHQQEKKNAEKGQENCKTLLAAKGGCLGKCPTQ